MTFYTVYLTHPNSAIKANGLHLNSNEIPVWVSGNGPNEVYNYIEHDMNVEFDNCNINIHNEPINPEESIRGLYVIGGEYNYSTKDYDFTTVKFPAKREKILKYALQSVKNHP